MPVLYRGSAVPKGQYEIKVKVKFTLEQAMKAQRGNTVTAVLLTLLLDGVGGQGHALAVLPSERTR